MNLSKKLELNYSNSEVIKEVVSRYPENLYNKKLLAIIEKQDMGEEVLDTDYANLQQGKGGLASAEYGYFLVNFHYHFHQLKYIKNPEEFEQRFFEFIKQIATTKNYINAIHDIKASYEYYLMDKYRDKLEVEINGYYKINEEWLTNLEKNIRNYLHDHDFSV